METPVCLNTGLWQKTSETRRGGYGCTCASCGWESNKAVTHMPERAACNKYRHRGICLPKQRDQNGGASQDRKAFIADAFRLCRQGSKKRDAFVLRLFQWKAYDKRLHPCCDLPGASARRGQERYVDLWIRMQSKRGGHFRAPPLLLKSLRFEDCIPVATQRAQALAEGSNGMLTCGYVCKAKEAGAFVLRLFC